MTAITGLPMYGSTQFGWPHGTPAFSNHPIDATNEGVAWTFMAETTDAITHLGFRYGSRTNTPCTYSIAVEGVSTSNGQPDGTDVGGGGSPTLVTFTPPDSTAWDGLWIWQALTNPYTPTNYGQMLASVIRYSSGSIAGFSSFTTGMSNLGNGNQHNFPGVWRNSGGTWSLTSQCPLFGYRTASGRYGYIMESLYTTRSAATAGHRVALKFTYASSTATSYQIRGLRASASISGSGSHAPLMKLWNNSGTVLQTVTLDSDQIRGQSGYHGYDRLLFTDTTLSTLTVGDTYYLGFEVGATSAGGGVLINGMQQNAAADLACLPNSDWILSTYNGSSWSDVTNVRPWAVPLIADVTQASGGGSGALVIANQGMTGIGQF